MKNKYSSAYIRQLFTINWIFLYFFYNGSFIRWLIKNTFECPPQKVLWSAVDVVKGSKDITLLVLLLWPLGTEFGVCIWRVSNTSGGPKRSRRCQIVQGVPKKSRRPKMSRGIQTVMRVPKSCNLQRMNSLSFLIYKINK